MIAGGKGHLCKNWSCWSVARSVMILFLRGVTGGRPTRACRPGTSRTLRTNSKLILSFHNHNEGSIVGKRYWTQCRQCFSELMRFWGENLNLFGYIQSFVFFLDYCIVFATIRRTKVAGNSDPGSAGHYHLFPKHVFERFYTLRRPALKFLTSLTLQ